MSPINHQTSDELEPLMDMFPRRQVLGTAAGVAAAAALPLASVSAAHAAEPLAEHAGPWAPVPDPVPVPLDSLYDNDGVDTASARGGDFDGSGYTFPGEELPTGRVEVDGTPFVLPASDAGAKNNVVALGQRVELPKGRYLSALFLTAGSYGNASGKATVHYADGSTTTAALGGSDWYATGGSLSAPYRYAPDGTRDEHRVGIGTSELWCDPQRDAVAITLPVTNPAQSIAVLEALVGQFFLVTAVAKVVENWWPRVWRDTPENSGDTAGPR
jgi:alpha-L-fucosidase